MFGNAGLACGVPACTDAEVGCADAGLACDPGVLRRRRMTPPPQASPASAHPTSASVHAGDQGRDRLAVARRALVRKRAGEVAAVWPLLAASLGPRWHDIVAAYVAGRAPAGALRDGWLLARDLDRCGGLSDAAAVELAEREVTLHHDGRRRLPAARRCGGGVVVQIGGRVHHFLLH